MGRTVLVHLPAGDLKIDNVPEDTTVETFIERLRVAGAVTGDVVALERDGETLPLDAIVDSDEVRVVVIKQIEGSLKSFVFAWIFFLIHAVTGLVGRYHGLGPGIVIYIPCLAVFAILCLIFKPSQRVFLEAKHFDTRRCIVLDVIWTFVRTLNPFFEIEDLIMGQ